MLLRHEGIRAYDCPMTTQTASPEITEMVRRAIMAQPPARQAQFASYLTGDIPVSRAQGIIRQLSGTVASTETGDIPRQRTNGGQTGSTGRTDWATDKQAAFAADLLRTRVSPDERVTGSVKTAAEVLALFAASGKMTRAMARNVIDSYKDRPRIVTPAPPAPRTANPVPFADTPPVEAGMYRLADDVFKVQKSRQSGRMYAKRLVVHGPGDATFEYESGAIRRITADDRMSLEDAKQFGAVYGVCCCCSATLTDEKSIAAGIGPVCAKKV